MNEAVISAHWKRQGGLLGIFLLLLFVFYYPSYSSMVAIWARSETFTHGFIIVPICAWLIWRIRKQIGITLPQTNYLGIPLLLLLGFLWLVANYVGVLAIEQLSATLMIPVLVFTLLGWRVTSVMIFPLLYILFAVPLGEELTPTLINLTADFTVALINLVGIPVYREGTYFQLPTGNWSVVAACSGISYLIASMTLGTLYAYLNYQGPLKRTIFIIASIVVPIIANSLRAFMIVMIGHFSDMQLATGVDHLIYGWVFFGVVIGIMFYIGSFWRDDVNAPLHGVEWAVGNVDSASLAHKMAIAVTCLTLVVWPIKIYLEQEAQDFSNVAKISISIPTGWTETPTAPTSWKPAYHSLDSESQISYRDNEGNEVMLFIGYYAQQRQGAELGNYDNVLVTEGDEVWRSIEGKKLTLTSASIEAPTAVIEGNSKRYLTTYFFYVDGQWVTNKYKTKLIQAKARLLSGRSDGAIIAITTQLPEQDHKMDELLKDFVTAAQENIKRSLDQMQ